MSATLTSKIKARESLSAPIGRLGRRRLTKLADFLAKLNPRLFDLAHWMSVDGGGTGVRIEDDSLLCKVAVKPRREQNLCGTTACAFGWATAIPSFRRAGLRMTTFGYEGEGCCGDVTFQGVCDTEAAMLFFGMTSAQADFLFIPNHYPMNKRTAKHVARRIRTLVKATTPAASRKR